MRVYGYATASFYTYLILILARTETSRDILGKHYDVQRQKTDKTTPSYSKTIQLYSKSSGKYVQVLGRAVNASGLRTSDAAILIIESATFGKVRIKHYKSNYYICMNGKGVPMGLAKKKGKHMRRCVFRPRSAKDGYIQFISDKFGRKKNVSRYLAFRHGGEPKLFYQVEGENEGATKFVMNMIDVSKKRNVKRNIRRHLIKHEFSLQEKNRHKERQGGKICLRYLRCLHKNWKMKRRGQIIRLITRCSRVLRRNNCRCKCAKQ